MRKVGSKQCVECRMSEPIRIEDFLSQASDEQRKAFEEAESIRILVIGEMGVGKSTLVNGIVGRRVAKEGAGPTAITKGLERFSETVSGVVIEIYDTPGLGDPNIKDEITLTNISELDELDLILVCVDIRLRISRTMVEMMQGITTKLGERKWKHALFALTFSNEVAESVFEGKLKVYEEQIYEYLTSRCGVSAAIGEKVPVVPTGHKLHKIPGCDDWLTNLWSKSYEALDGKPKYALLKINQERITTKPDTRVVEPCDRKINGGWLRRNCIFL